jgi:hypothetical protein
VPPFVHLKALDNVLRNDGVIRHCRIVGQSVSAKYRDL